MSKMHQQARKEKISVRARAHICENEQTAQTHIIYVSGEQSFADNSIFIIDTLTINAVRSRDARILFIKSTQVLLIHTFVLVPHPVTKLYLCSTAK